MGFAPPASAQPEPEVRGVWLTTTANDHIATPQRTAETMRRLREIGINTVYVEAWKNGYAQFPSDTLERAIGVRHRPVNVKADPSDADTNRFISPKDSNARDLLGETLLEAHRNQLVYIAWFEYGFMAAHGQTDNHLRRMKPEWLSRDINGSEVAPNGFVWMNPLHPECRRFLLDLVLEAVAKYDLDGVQLDDRIVWPYVTMGYDDYTVAAYRNEHGGREPPADHKDAAWMRWRADKVNEYAEQFVAEVRAARPGLIVSLSPAPYPWCYEHYLLEWPVWAAWERGPAPQGGWRSWWDEFVPQCYRYDADAFIATWDQQLDQLRRAGAEHRARDMLAGILTSGERAVPWEHLQRKLDHTRANPGGGHVWWFSRGVLDLYPTQIAAAYDAARLGHARHPAFPPDWRPAPIALEPGFASAPDGDQPWRTAHAVPAGRYRVISRSADPANGWRVEEQVNLSQPGVVEFSGPGGLDLEAIASGWIPDAFELLVDRREDLAQPR